MMTAKTIFCSNDYIKTVSKLTGKIQYFLLLLFVVLSFVGVTKAQTPVFVKNYRYSGQVTQGVNGNYVPYPNIPILVNITSGLGNSSGQFVTAAIVTAVVTTDSNGRYEYILPCYVDANGVWAPGYQANIRTIGGLGGRSPTGGMSGCTLPDTAFLNEDFNASGAGEELQNGGASCQAGKIGNVAPQPTHDVGEPVNVTNGNMWLAQTDYNLPGVGENISINRYYNSVIQESGIFGFGWKSEYDESITNFNNEYLTLRTGTGRGFYFANIGNNVFASASIGFYAQVVKNAADNTYTLTFKDGRVHKFYANGRLDWQKDRNGNQTTLNYDTINNRLIVTDAFGRTLTITLNANGTASSINDSISTIATYEYYPNTNLLKTVTYNDGSKYKFEYDTTSAAGKTLLKTVKDALDNILETHDYDASGRATTSGKAVNGAVEKYTLDYSQINAANPSTTATDALGRVTKYYFDKSKGRNVVTKMEGVCGCGGSGSEVTQYFYDDRLNLTKKIDALNQQTLYTYDPNGNRLTQTDQVGTTNLGTHTFTYNNFGEVLTWTDKMGGIWTNTYDANGNLKTTTDALGQVTTITYPTTNNKGLPDSVKDARLNLTKLKWFAASGLLEEVEDANNKKTNFTYDARGRIKTVTNALNHTTTYNYFDDTQRKVEMIYPNADKITYKYDIRRLLESITDERGKLTNYEFDAAYRLKKVTDALGHAQEIDYDLMSNIKLSKDALGNQSDYVYDDFNRLKEMIYPAANVGEIRLKEKFEYDTVGRIKKIIDTANRETIYNYDDASRTVSVTNAENETTQTKYNARMQAIEVKDALNQVYQFTPDALGRVLTQTRAGGTMSYEYDEVGNRKKRTDYAGRITNYTYDKLNRLEKIEYDHGTTNPTPKQTATYGYNDISQLISATNEAGTVTFGYDNRHRQTSTTDVFGHTINYEYERTSTVNQERLKFDGAMYAKYNFDDANRLENILSVADNATISFGYDNANRMISRNLPNGVSTTYGYDNMSRLKLIRDVSSSGTLFDRQYGYNNASQINQISEPTNTRTIGYDLVNRLTSVTSASGNESYNFDDVGNRTSSHRSATYNYQPFNKVVATSSAIYNYDANGNMVSKAEGSNFWRYGFDYENRLVTASNRKQTVRYRYDALGRRVQRYTVGGKENTKFIYDGQDVLVDDNGGTLTKYINGAGIDNKLRQTTGSNTQYFLSDHLGSTNGLTDSSGNLTASTSYDAFGNATNANFSSRYQFTGREYDNFTGLHYYRARFYDGNLGRFISEDPIGLSGGVNLFGYVGNNPLGYTDSMGLTPDWDQKLWQAGQNVIDFYAPAIEFGIGFGDYTTLGIARYIRQWEGIDDANLDCSTAYQAGQWAGFAVDIATGASGLIKAAGKFGLRNLAKNGAKDLLNSLNKFPRSTGLRQIRPNGAVHDLVDPNGLLQLNPTRLIVSENHIKDIVKVFNNYNGKLNAFRPEFWQHALPHRHIYDLRNAPTVLNANWRTTFQNLGAVKTTVWW